MTRIASCVLFTWISKPFDGEAAFVLELGEHVDAAVRVGARHHVHLQLEVAEGVVHERAVVVRVAGGALGDDRAILDLEGLRGCR